MNLGKNLLAVEERNEDIECKASSGIDQQLKSLLHEPNRQHHHIIAKMLAIDCLYRSRRVSATDKRRPLSNKNS